MTLAWEILKILTPPLLAAFFTGYLVNRLKAREDGIDKRLDELYTEIKLAAADAADYWQTEAIAPDIKLKAAKVQAGIGRLGGLHSMLSTHVSSAASVEITKAASDFMRTATGGDFGVHNRLADVQRAALVHLQAADFAVAVRRARMSDLRGWFRRG